MVRAFASDAPSFVLILAATGAVFASASAADVFFCGALSCEMAPSPAFHALDGLGLLLSWPNPGAAYDQPVPDEDVSTVHGCNA